MLAWTTTSLTSREYLPRGMFLYWTCLLRYTSRSRRILSLFLSAAAQVSYITLYLSLGPWNPGGSRAGHLYEVYCFSARYLDVCTFIDVNYLGLVYIRVQSFGGRVEHTKKHPGMVLRVIT